MPVTSVEAEHLFSQYKHSLNKRESHIPENLEQFTMLYYMAI